MDREEAIKIIRKNMPSDKSLPVYEALRALIPELAESEDEKIRKHLIEVVELYWGTTNEPGKAEDLAWLEKQKDLDKMIVVSPEVWDKAIADAYKNGKKDGEKQKEQKPVQTEVDLEKKIDDYIAFNFSEAADGILISDANSTELQITDVSRLARHFYELGLNARKP